MHVCLTEAELKAFSIGDLPEAELDRAGHHIEHCNDCDERLRRLDHHADALIDNLRSLSDGSATMLKTAPKHIVEHAERVVRTTMSGESLDVSLDSGRHYSRLLKDGPCRLGRFELLDEIGVGSFGYVFRARDPELDRIVAVKIQRAGSVATDEEAKRFLREARSAASLTHPSIVSLFDTGQTEDGVCFLVTEFVDGETLEQKLRRARPDFGAAAELVAQLAQALQYAHEHGVIHRDIKPSNVVIDETGHPHIADFGLAKRDAADASMTSDGHVLGTPAYMSPEQARGESELIDARTDVYSLGVMLYEMLTGERPFHGTKRLLLLQVLEDDPRPPRLLDDRIPRDLETICLTAMAKSPARRYQSASQLADDLRRFERGDAILARPVSPAERLWRWCHRYPLAAGLFAVVLLGAIAGFAYLSDLSGDLVNATALDSARNEADMLEDVQLFYSDVLRTLDHKAHGVEIDHRYRDRPDTLPLPATFLIDAAQRISQNETGIRARLYSQYPFRENGGPKTGFERTALDECASQVPLDPSRAARDVEYYEFVSIDNRAYLQYARGWLMKESCLDCHRKHPQSPKRDWEEGDLVGVLAITRPLDQDIARTQAGLRGAFVLMGVAAVTLVLLSLAIAMRMRAVARK